MKVSRVSFHGKIASVSQLDPEKARHMHTVTSRDSTHIAFWRSGTGPPLLLVHGATYDHTTWRLVLPELEQRLMISQQSRQGSKYTWF